MRVMRSLAAGVAFYSVLVAATPPAQAEQAIFKIADPRGDDHGDGELIYPTRRSDLERGDLDLVELAAFAAPGGTVFRATFARPVRRPGGEAIDGLGTQLDREARLGFYTFNLDLYVDTDRLPGSGEVAMLPGRRAEVAAPFAWEKVIALTPRPQALRAAITRLRVREWKEEQSRKRTVSREEARQRRRQVAEELLPLVYFPTRVKVFARQVELFVPEEFLGGAARPDWAYAVVITGAQLTPRRFELPWVGKWGEASADGLLLPLLAGADGETFGGGRDDEPLQPPVVDLLLPAGAARSQEEILRDYDSYQERRAQIPGVVPGG